MNSDNTIIEDNMFLQQRKILDSKQCYAQQILRRIESPQNNYSDDELSIRCKMKLEANNE